MMTAEPIGSIIDDDPSVRRGLTRLIRTAGMSAQSFRSAGEFLASGGINAPGCIVLDVKMPGMTGPELQEELRKAEYCPSIIFLSAHADVPTVAVGMKKGAVDFLAKPVDRDDLLAAIRDGLSRNATRRAELNDRRLLRKHIEKLTTREHEIMTYVITGMLNKQIAGELGIAEDTVKIHRGRVMHKLGIVSVAELVRLCEKAGIRPGEPSGR